jgi:hypothetical protein
MPAILPDAEAACLVDRIETVRRYATAGKAWPIETPRVRRPPDLDAGTDAVARGMTALDRRTDGSVPPVGMDLA